LYRTHPFFLGLKKVEKGASYTRANTVLLGNIEVFGTARLVIVKRTLFQESVSVLPVGMGQLVRCDVLRAPSASTVASDVNV